MSHEKDIALSHKHKTKKKTNKVCYVKIADHRHAEIHTQKKQPLNSEY